ncbi:MAG: hypothetical protein O7C62_07560 [Rickettsia endosymbiont of Ixodes persulcatus]|nr:hypothetical protein [Rickettsia endosymbiont of Ixodes persulcatus]
MKTTLPERSLKISARLNFIVQQILDIAQDKIAMIILYGSISLSPIITTDLVPDKEIELTKSVNPKSRVIAKLMPKVRLF